MNIQLIVNKQDVYNEVAKLSSYTGAKMVNDEDAYSRIFTTDEDRLMLERFFTEASDVVTDALREFVTAVSYHNTGHGVDLSVNYVVNLAMSAGWDTTFSSNLNSDIFSFFVYYILQKWYALTNKDEAEAYSAEATKYMAAITRNAYSRVKPKRVIPTPEPPEDEDDGGFTEA